ncbi:hypothetical protein BS78_06G197400 [Paspalum vaginatum]|nr:hypothetical protein BS78_06G197400 [Paspalum vaginatum]
MVYPRFKTLIGGPSRTHQTAFGIAVYKETRLLNQVQTAKPEKSESTRARAVISDTYSYGTAMSPASSYPCFDHSYKLPLRRNLRLLLDLLRFVAGVLLDRLGVASSCQGEVLLPGHPWGGELPDDDDDDDDDAALERFLEARFWEAGMRSLTAPPRYRRRRVIVRRPEEGDGAAVCVICLAGLDAGGGCQTVEELCGCAHAFHAACIDAWAGSAEAATCPLCRAPMLPTASDC